MKEISFRKLVQQDVEQAVKLTLREYEAECKQCDQLLRDPVFYAESVSGMLSELCKQRYTRGAFVKEQEGQQEQQGGREQSQYREQLVGYVACWGPMEGFFGNVKGVFCPLGGSAFSDDAGMDRGKLASMLYASLGEELASQDICSHAICLFAHDKQLAESFVLNGFGIRCSDAVMELDKRQGLDFDSSFDSRFTFEEVPQEQWRQLVPMDRGLTRHLGKAPVYFPTPVEHEQVFLEKADKRIFAAYDNEKKQYAGYFSLTDEGETMLTQSNRMGNICGTYVKPEYRKQGIADQLLAYLCRVCEQEGKEYLGVDCETLNPTALRFWGKHFQNYTYSYHRRIDERIVGYEEYLKEHWGTVSED